MNKEKDIITLKTLNCWQKVRSTNLEEKFLKLTQTFSPN
jgi:hypothetical protein